jgi:hypothetical protein
MDKEVERLVNRGDQFERFWPAHDPTRQSMVFHSLWFNSVALMDGDLNAFLATVQQALGTLPGSAF